ncbi:hypothetical protein GCM10022254_09610 [Actinomadura meridiana]|uniref:SWIM-type domain-containing protein n=1 Tax=Actinomadura meridiana TaxID=559626 RepID=A0ABP8BUI2_9ACTN
MNLSATTPKTATCTRCRATLRSAKSVAREIGPTCERLARQEAAAKAAGFKAATVEKARELIADGGIAPLRTMKSGKRIFRTASERTGEIYLTAAQGCTCPAGLRGKHSCYHRAAATMLAA